MKSLILSVTARALLPLLLLFSLFQLVRGHNEPGGGFIGGLVAAAAFVLYAIAYNVPAARKALRISPRALVAAGLILALGSGIVSLFLGQPFLTGQWGSTPLPIIGKLGSPLVFDIGVFLTVVGSVLTTIFAAMEE